jgi:predicted GNAT superfamily acetyltransferase
MRWTFDPLQGRNAHVNFSKLGIVCREYVEDMYGETGSPLHRGIGTDRLVAVWDMDSERVESRLAKGAEGPSMEGLSHAPQLLPVLEDGVVPAPGAPILGLDDPRILLAVPDVIDAMMEGDMSMAMRWRKATREAFNHYFSRGYEAREFLRGEGVSFYLLVAADEKPSGAAERTTP